MRDVFDLHIYNSHNATFNLLISNVLIKDPVETSILLHRWRLLPKTKGMTAEIPTFLSKLFVNSIENQLRFSHLLYFLQFFLLLLVPPEGRQCRSDVLRRRSLVHRWRGAETRSVSVAGRFRPGSPAQRLQVPMWRSVQRSEVPEPR